MNCNYKRSWSPSFEGCFRKEECLEKKEHLKIFESFCFIPALLETCFNLDFFEECKTGGSSTLSSFLTIFQSISFEDESQKVIRSFYLRLINIDCVRFQTLVFYNHVIDLQHIWARINYGDNLNDWRIFTVHSSQVNWRTLIGLGLTLVHDCFTVVN